MDEPNRILDTMTWFGTGVAMIICIYGVYGYYSYRKHLKKSLKAEEKAKAERFVSSQKPTTRKRPDKKSDEIRIRRTFERSSSRGVSRHEDSDAVVAAALTYDALSDMGSSSDSGGGGGGCSDSGGSSGGGGCDGGGGGGGE